jgi:hypothetical protein
MYWLVRLKVTLTGERWADLILMRRIHKIPYHDAYFHCNKLMLKTRATSTPPPPLPRLQRSRRPIRPMSWRKFYSCSFEIMFVNPTAVRARESPAYQVVAREISMSAK